MLEQTLKLTRNHFPSKLSTSTVPTAKKAALYNCWAMLTARALRKTFATARKVVSCPVSYSDVFCDNFIDGKDNRYAEDSRVRRM